MRVTKAGILTILMATSLSACSTLGIGVPNERWADYKTWTKITENRPVVGDPTGYIGTRHMGSEGYKDIYVNDIGKAVLSSDGPYLFPIGTVLVKEQYANESAWQKQQKPGITVSVKVSDVPDSPNWHWADSYNSAAKENLFCLGCHSHAYADDFVFSNQRFLSSL